MKLLVPLLLCNFLDWGRKREAGRLGVSAWRNRGIEKHLTSAMSEWSHTKKRDRGANWGSRLEIESQWCFVFSTFNWLAGRGWRSRPSSNERRAATRVAPCLRAARSRAGRTWAFRLLVAIGRALTDERGEWAWRSRMESDLLLGSFLNSFRLFILFLFISLRSGAKLQNELAKKNRTKENAYLARHLARRRARSFACIDSAKKQLLQRDCVGGLAAPHNGVARNGRRGKNTKSHCAQCKRRGQLRGELLNCMRLVGARSLNWISGHERTDGTTGTLGDNGPLE